jgi:hypothetical protein
MAKGNISLHKGDVTVEVWQTEANATAIYAGEPVKLKSAGSPYVIPLADNEPVIGTTTQVIGIAASDSTQTASADGVIAVYIPDGDAEWEVAPTTLTNADAQSEVNALVGDRVLFDLVGSTYTLDENAGDTATSGLQITGGDATRGKMYFRIRPAALQGPVA